MDKVESNTNKLNAIPQLRDVMQGQELLLAYRGVLSQAITQTFLSMTDKLPDAEEVEASSRTKIFNVMVECMQNICNQSEQANNENLAIFMMGRQNSVVTLYSGSLVENEQVPYLEKLLKNINGMGKEESKKMINDIDVFGAFSSSNAHIGLIDLANECGHSLEHNFEDVNDKYTYFSLRTTINES